MAQPSAWQRQQIMSDQFDLYKNGIRPVSGDGAPTDGISGTGVDKCGPGSLYHDKTNGYLWINEGSKASPAWGFTGTQVTT